MEQVAHFFLGLRFKHNAGEVISQIKQPMPPPSSSDYFRVHAANHATPAICCQIRSEIHPVNASVLRKTAAELHTV